LQNLKGLKMEIKIFVDDDFRENYFKSIGKKYLNDKNLKRRYKKGKL